MISTYSWYKAKAMEISYQKHLYEKGKSATITLNPFDDKSSDLVFAVSSVQWDLSGSWEGISDPQMMPELLNEAFSVKPTQQ